MARATTKRLGKLLISCVWYAATRLRDLVARPERRLTILYYHAIPAALAVAFGRQMAHLARHCTIVSPDHRGPLDRRLPSVAVTFDDAFRSVRENALPALAEHRVPATIFVPTGYLGRSPGWAMETAGDRAETVMTAEEISDLPDGLIAIGSHTVHHPHLSTLAPEQVTEQLVRSRATLEELLGRTADTLAFPYGDHDDQVVALCAAAGYARVYSVAPEAVDTCSDAIKRGRTPADPADGAVEFWLKARGAYAWMPIASAIKKALR